MSYLQVVLKSKLEKADLLEMANAYILHLQSSRVYSNPGSVSSYSLGFNECAAEVAKYIDSNEGHVKGEGDTGIHARLLEHLTSFASSKDVVEKCARERARARASAVDAAEKPETNDPQSVPKGANSASLAGDNETVGETSQRSGSGESGLVLENTSGPSEDSNAQNLLSFHFNSSESNNGMANNSDFVSNVSDSLERQKYIIPRKPERSVTIKADMVNSDKLDRSPSAPKDDHVATPTQKTLADTTQAPPQARVPKKDFGHVTSQIRIPLVNTNNVTHDGGKTCRRTKLPQRTPVSNAGNMMTSHPGFPINKQPIRKRLAAQYQNRSNAKTDDSNNICFTLKQPEKERQIDMAKAEKENEYEVEQVSEIYTNKENDNKLERMVELTAKVLTQNCPRNYTENKSKEVYIQPVKEVDAGQRNDLPEDIGYGYSIFRPELRTGGSSEDVWRPW